MVAMTLRSVAEVKVPMTQSGIDVAVSTVILTLRRGEDGSAVLALPLVLRTREPHRPRVFRTPLAWVVGPVAMIKAVLPGMRAPWSVPRPRRAACAP